MTVEDRYFATGMRVASFYELSQITGRLKAPVTHLPYYGLVLYGPKSLNLNVPEPRKITHVGQDRPLQVDWLPATEGMDAEVNVSATEVNVQAAVDGTKVQTIGTAKLVPVFSSKQGFNPSLGAWFTRQAENVDGDRRWESFIFNKSKVVYQPAGMSDGNAEPKYKIAPAIAKHKLWGEVWSDSDNGAETAQMGQMLSNGFPYLVGWQSGTSDVSFPFDTDKPAINTGNAILGVYVGSSAGDALVPSSDYTVAVTGITFLTAPGLDTNPADSDNPGKIITCIYEGPMIVRE